MTEREVSFLSHRIVVVASGCGLDNYIPQDIYGHSYVWCTNRRLSSAEKPQPSVDPLL